MALKDYLTAARVGVDMFKFALENPNAIQDGDTKHRRMMQYELGWNAYTNEVFNIQAGWKSYARGASLYEETRAIYNPVTRLVDFYASHVYPGVLTTDAESLPDGEMSAIPISNASPETLDALGQLWQWSNWKINKDKLVIWCAAMGDVAIEALEDIERGKVYARLIPPAQVVELEFDVNASDNIIRYVLEYDFYDKHDDETYTYRKEVDKETIRTYRDDEPYDYGGGSVRDNPYGFCPLVWNSHRNIGTLPGGAAVRSWRKIEILNSLASRVQDYIRAQSQSPQLLVGSGTITRAFTDASRENRDIIKILKLDGDGHVEPLKGNLEMAAVEERIKSIVTEIEHDHPEVTMYQKMREMTQVSGVAVDRLLGDVKGAVLRARAGYDSATERVFKMLITIAGMRANERVGGWARQTDEQKKFLPFNLESFERGDMEFDIASRPLMPKTNAEYWAEQDAKYTAIAKGNDAGYPTLYQEKQNGMTDDQLQELEDAQNAMAAQEYSDMPPVR